MKSARRINCRKSNKKSLPRTTFETPRKPPPGAPAGACARQPHAADQQALVDAIKSGPRGPFNNDGPFAVFLHAPAFGMLAQTARRPFALQYQRAAAAFGIRHAVHAGSSGRRNMNGMRMRRSPPSRASKKRPSAI